MLHTHKTLKLIGLGFLAAIALYLIFIVGLMYLNRFFEKNYLQFNSVVQIKFNWPITVKPRVKPALPTPPKKKVQIIKEVHAEEFAATAPAPTVWTNREIADYIKSKGWDYSIAIRLAKSENFWNLNHSFDCARVGPTNSNGSHDTGIFQINSIHERTLAKWGWTLEDMKDCKKNIDFAYGHVYLSAGWGAWSAYNNKSYLSHDETI